MLGIDVAGKSQSSGSKTERQCALGFTATDHVFVVYEEIEIVLRRQRSSGIAGVSLGILSSLWSLCLSFNTFLKSHFSVFDLRAAITLRRRQIWACTDDELARDDSMSLTRKSFPLLTQYVSDNQRFAKMTS